jgi:hypothetical protein
LIWLQKNWHTLINGKMSHLFYGKGFYVFQFETKEERYLIFISDTYFMGARGMYLNKWTLEFNPKKDVP